MTDVIVIGGGAAGMMAAIHAASAGASVLLLERNEKLGKKIYITGKGRCNVTNAAGMDVIQANIMRNPRFCYAALNRLSNTQLMAFFEAQGVPLKVERGERVFPVSDHASDITRALDVAMSKLGVKTMLRTRVAELMVDDHGAAAGVVTDTGAQYAAKAVIVATGGLSYPSTGSTGDGFRIAQDTGHRVKDGVPALTSIETVESWPWGLSGLTLKNVTLTCHGKKNKPLWRDMGELLMTHYGISGPLALTLSSVMPEDERGMTLSLDLKPALDEATLDRRVQRELSEHSRQMMSSIMDTLEPHALGLCVLDVARIPHDLPANALTKEQRRALVASLKNMPLTVKCRRGFSEAVITRGGVHVGDIDPSTMMSKKMPGLYFAGETIDIDALTGGFNLQLAFSTGALAGESAAVYINSQE